MADKSESPAARRVREAEEELKDPLYWLETLEDVVSMMDRRDELMELVWASRDHAQLVRDLQKPPWSVSSASAEHVADLSLGALTEEERSGYVTERDLLRRLRDGTLTPEERAEIRARRPLRKPR